jgi:hypothetical protein
MIQLELETLLGKALLEDNSYSGEYTYMDSSYYTRKILKELDACLYTGF